MSKKAESDIRALLPLRPVEFQVLLVLADGDLHGYGIIRETERRTDGELILEPGTLYRAIRRMVVAGLVDEAARRPASDSDDERRRYFTITKLGRKVAAAEATRMERLVAAARQSALLQTARPAVRRI